MTSPAKLASRIFLLIVILSFLNGPGSLTVSAAEDPSAPLPPGVKIIDEQKLNRSLPPNYAAAGLDVDWTHPLLQVSALASGEMLRPQTKPTEGQSTATTMLGMAWARAASKNPGSLMIQLIEPRDESTTYPLPVSLNVSAASEIASAYEQFDDHPHEIIGGPFPWLLNGPAVANDPAPASPLINYPSRARLGARWIGRLADIDSIHLPFSERLLFSLTLPGQTHTNFILLWRQDNSDGSVEECRAWLKTLAPPRSWLVFHAAGPQALIGLDDWRLGPASDPRRNERLGAAMTLSSIAAADASGEGAGLVDWARMQGTTWESSSYERDFGAWLLGSGRVLSDPLSPAIWMSRPPESGSSPDGSGSGQEESSWCSVKFARPRLIHHIAIYWASSAGWDSQFNPCTAVLDVEWADAAEPKSFPLHPGSDPISIVQENSLNDRPVSSLRLRLLEPEQQPNPSARARVVALQAWGPWDGETIPAPQ